MRGRRPGRRCRGGFADSAPFLTISRASLDDLNNRMQTPVDMSRCRPNIVIDGGLAFQEDRWQRIRIREPLETLGSYRYGPRGIRFGRKAVHENLGTIGAVAATGT